MLLPCLHNICRSCFLRRQNCLVNFIYTEVGLGDRTLSKFLSRPLASAPRLKHLKWNSFDRKKKMERKHDEQDEWMDIGKYKIYPWSIAGIESTIVVKSDDLHITFDMGYCCRKSVRSKFVFITHGHMDHISAVVQHAARRDLYSMKPARYFVPEHLSETVRAVAEGFNKMQEITKNIDIVPVSIGDRIKLPGDYFMKPFPTVHRIKSQGYILYKQTKKLKEEYHGLPANEIAAMNREGVQIHNISEVPEVAYTGDTTFEVFENAPDPDLLRVRILIMEVTYIDSEPGKDMCQMARDRGHTHLMELVQNAHLFEHVESIILFHFSDKYSPEYIKCIVDQNLSETLKKKVYLATVAAEKNR